MTAGIALPMLEKPFGWRAAAVVTVVALVLTVFLLQPVRRGLDARRSRSQSRPW